jgi:hypothetical protein
VIRAFNVLRQYDESAVPAAHGLMCSHLLPGGLLMEGTSDPWGRIWVSNIIRKTSEKEWRLEGLVFSTNFKGDPFEPAVFQSVLPKNFIHRMLPGEKVHEFFEDWRKCHEDALSVREYGTRFVFVDTALRLADKGKYNIVYNKRWFRLGFLVWLFDS